MTAIKLESRLNIFNDFSFLNKDKNDLFLEQKVTLHKFNDKEIILNGSYADQNFLNIIAFGSVNVISPILNSDKIINYKLGVGCLLGLESIICEYGSLPVIASALGNVEIYRIPKEALLKQCNNVEVLNKLFQCYIKTMQYVMV